MENVEFVAAAISDQARLIKAMARKGAGVNALDALGKAPLHYAVAAGSAKERRGDLQGMELTCMTVKALLQYGANLMLKDKQGNCPLALASTDMSGVIEDEVLELQMHGEPSSSSLSF